MTVQLMSILVSDQGKALAFYTGILGFVKKVEIPMGEHRWLTVVSKEAPDGVQLVMEPMAFAPAKTYQEALYEAGIPLAVFNVPDLQKEYDRLLGLGVRFSMKPTKMGPATIAVLDDTCGNNIQLLEV